MTVEVLIGLLVGSIIFLVGVAYWADGLLVKKVDEQLKEVQAWAKIPFVDIKALSKQIRDEVRNEIVTERIDVKA